VLAMGKAPTQFVPTHDDAPGDGCSEFEIDHTNE
jgi:hypothetical protein